ncbi:unnamed protein product [Vicia faba]|uniref:DUF7086 domain-containing protein n=1 Tax=Vicia faba TaxID=3906 RepID=A0AAV0ZN41_VICFA|nr:unnamed protein product [Vicia faba]
MSNSNQHESKESSETSSPPELQSSIHDPQHVPRSMSKELTPFQRMFSDPNLPPQPQQSLQDPIPKLTPFQRMFSKQIPPPQPTVQSRVPQLRPFHFQPIFSHPVPRPRPLIPPLQQPILYFPPRPSHPPPPSPPYQPPRVRARLNLPSEKSETIPIPFPWATNRRASIHSIHYLRQNGIVNITGDVQCKRCDAAFQMSFDVREKFPELWTYILENRQFMNDRAPPNVWMNPTLPDCVHCNQENCVKPIIAKKKKNINWLFLLLGQLLGCCNLAQLKYCCKHTNNHRTGAKDRVLYLTYLALCKQLDSTGPFNV